MQSIMLDGMQRSIVDTLLVFALDARWILTIVTAPNVRTTLLCQPLLYRHWTEVCNGLLFFTCLARKACRHRHVHLRDGTASASG